VGERETRERETGERETRERETREREGTWGPSLKSRSSEEAGRLWRCAGRDMRARSKLLGARSGYSPREREREREMCEVQVVRGADRILP
jgi:hypothetical protein